mmetsp:Transcript_160439/g.514964  ORF Transcript_160439/g.514964 Transcript_160439/m.514964 type:complete len:768 (-) Transcript_160439:76-2379(-)
MRRSCPSVSGPVAWGGRLLRPTSLREADEEDVLSPTTSPEGGQSLPLLKADGSADDEGSDLSPTGADGSVSGRARVVFADSHAAGRRRVIVRAVPPAILLVAAAAAIVVGERRQPRLLSQWQQQHQQHSPDAVLDAAAGVVGLSGMRDTGAKADAIGKSDGRVDEQVCNGQPGLGRQEARRWQLAEAENNVCYELNHGSFMGRDVPKGDRNWCWVDLKRRGCHARLGFRLNWEEFNAAAIAGGSANPPEKFEPLLSPDVCDRREFGTTRAWTSQELEMARDWFHTNVNIYVLNLKMNVVRWKIIDARLKELHLAAERVEGVDMREPGAFDDAKKEGLIPSNFDLTLAEDDAWKVGLGGILGRVGCASAHFKAQATAMKASPRKPLAVVFEDDVWPEKDFVTRLWSMVTSELPCDWEAVSLSSKCPYGKCISPHLSRVQPDGNEPADSCHGGVNYGFQGMLYRVDQLEGLQERWKPVVFNVSRPHCLDVDVALASISDQAAYYAVPFTQQPGFLSEILQKSSRETVDAADAVTASSNSPTCSAHPGCSGLQGDCCPTASNTRLNCCEVTPETCGDIESGVDFVVQSDWGYSVNQVASPDICWTKCQEVPMCQAWTWIKDAGLGGLFPGQCWLKGGLPTIKEKKDGFVSGTLPRAKAYFSAPPAAESVQEGAGNACLEIVNDIEYVVESPQEQRNFWSVFKDHVETADDCCSMCNAEPTCGSWTFVRDAHLPSGPPGQCWLKGGKPTGSTQKSGIISGLRAGVRSMAMK